MRRFLFMLALVPCLFAGGGFQAGVASIDITPKENIWLSGYGARTHESEGVLTPIHAKALALTDGKQKVVILTLDLVGVTRTLVDSVAVEAMKQYGIPRAGLLINVSHTHTGPAVRDNLNIMFDWTPEQEGRVRAS